MKLMIVRHADPDYSIDSLTPVGWEEARLLAERMAKLDITDFYVSPLGRARDTASLTLEKMDRKAEVCPWLREFEAPIYKPDSPKPGCTWDWLPQDWTVEPRYYDPDRWTEPEVMQAGDVAGQAEWVASHLDAVLAAHGYERDGNLYRAVRPNTDTLAFFCHFGVECVMLGHLLHVSPMVLWHGMCAAPSSVTILNTEERRKGIASFRMSTFGDTSHLYAGGREPSFAARFCETWENMDQRHD
ncbi:MAG: histidine phosphatase family protein [bacterium]|nr:histidine phosphatase family protein [bacterium]MDD5857876.1 histidine phosphatase family protein [bacterium]